MSTKTTETEEMARRAFDAFHSRVLPWVTPVARTLTGKPTLKVAVSPEGVPCTDGKTVYLRVDHRLGKYLPHDKSLCGETGMHGAQLCEACALFETILIEACHEIAHITESSFDSVPDEDFAEMMDALVAEIPGKRGEQLRDRFAAARSAGLEHNFWDLTYTVSPYLKTILNALEDARINAAMYKARPGTHRMMHTHLIETFEKGSVASDGEVRNWKDSDLDLQVLIGVFLLASGYEPSEDWLSPKAIEALRDPKLRRMCQDVPTLRSVRQVYGRSVKILEQVRSLGFCKKHDPEPDPEEDPGKGSPEAGESSDSDGVTAEAGDDSDGTTEGSPTPDDAAGGDEEVADDGERKSSDRVSDEDEDAEATAEDDDAGSSVSSDGDSEDGSGGEDEADDEEAEQEDHDSDDTTGSSGESSDSGDDVSDDSDDSDEDVEGDATVESGGGDDTMGDRADSSYDAADEAGESSGMSPEDIDREMRRFGGHGDASDKSDRSEELDESEQEAFDRMMERLAKFGEDFDSPPVGIEGLRVHRMKNGSILDDYKMVHPGWKGSATDIRVDETTISPALLRARIVFANNRKGALAPNLKSGRVSAGKVGLRAPVGDPRLFEKRSQPGKRDYFVVIGIDISGSTASAAEYDTKTGRRVQRIEVMKKAAYGQAELLNRLGIKFAVYAHTGDSAPTYPYGIYLDMFEIKSPREPWSDECRNRLARLTHSAANLDGHTMEFYRKVAMSQNATDKIVLYYTDGSMPAENFYEEKEIIGREIVEYARHGIRHLFVSMNNDEPKKYGLDTVRIDSADDLRKVVDALGEKLTGTSASYGRGMG